MKLLLSTRRGFLVAMASLIAPIGVLFRKKSVQSNPLLGNWSIRKYICDGKQVQTENMDVSVSITDETITTTIQIPGIPVHIETHRYSICRSSQRIDMIAKNGGQFQGVYTQDSRGVTVAWDTNGQDRPKTVDEPSRFGLNRIELSRESGLV